MEGMGHTFPQAEHPPGDLVSEEAGGTQTQQETSNTTQKGDDGGGKEGETDEMYPDPAWADNLEEEEKETPSQARNRRESHMVYSFARKRTCLEISRLPGLTRQTEGAEKSRGRTATLTSQRGVASGFPARATITGTWGGDSASAQTNGSPQPSPLGERRKGSLNASNGISHHRSETTTEHEKVGEEGNMRLPTAEEESVDEVTDDQQTHEGEEDLGEEDSGDVSSGETVAEEEFFNSISGFVVIDGDDDLLSPRSGSASCSPADSPLIRSRSSPATPRSLPTSPREASSSPNFEVVDSMPFEVRGRPRSSAIFFQKEAKVSWCRMQPRTSTSGSKLAQSGSNLREDSSNGDRSPPGWQKADWRKSADGSRLKLSGSGLTLGGVKIEAYLEQKRQEEEQASSPTLASRLAELRDSAEVKSDGDTPGTPKTQKRKKKKKKAEKQKKVRTKPKLKDKILLDVLVLEACDLGGPRNVLERLYGGKLHSPYVKVGISGTAPQYLHYLSRPIICKEHPIWNDALTFEYHLFSAEELWNASQHGLDTTPESPLTEKKHWHRLLKTKKSPSEQEFFDKWEIVAGKMKEKEKDSPRGAPSSDYSSLAPDRQAFFEKWAQHLNEKPTLFIKLYFTTTGKKEGICAGGVEVPLSNLEADHLHDMWLHINPMQSILEKNNARMEDFVSWGSVHIVTQKIAEGKSGLMTHHGVAVPPIPLRMKVGDIILFESSDILTQGTKIATRSQWDHAAMIVKEHGSQDLCLFEATMSGVQLYHLTPRLMSYLTDTRIGVRRLQAHRTKEMMRALYAFMDEVVGRPYKKNPVEFLRALSKDNASDNLESIFCSQLVAAAYQAMGLLTKGVASNNYLPSDLASENVTYSLLHGATLSKIGVIPSQKLARQQLKKKKAQEKQARKKDKEKDRN